MQLQLWPGSHPDSIKALKGKAPETENSRDLNSRWTFSVSGKPHICRYVEVRATAANDVPPEAAWDAVGT